MSNLERGRARQSTGSHNRSQSLGANPTTPMYLKAGQRSQSVPATSVHSVPHVPQPQLVSLLGVIVDNGTTMSFVPFFRLPSSVKKGKQLEVLESRYKAHYLLYRSVHQRAKELLEEYGHKETAYILPVQMQCSMRPYQGKGTAPPGFQPLQLLDIQKVVRCSRSLARAMTLTRELASQLPKYNYTQERGQSIFSRAIDPRGHLRTSYISIDKTNGAKLCIGTLYQAGLEIAFLPVRGLTYYMRDGGYNGSYNLWGSQLKQAKRIMGDKPASIGVAVLAMCKLEPKRYDDRGLPMRSLEVLEIVRPLSPLVSIKNKQRLSWSAQQINQLPIYSPATRCIQHNFKCQLVAIGPLASSKASTAVTKPVRK